MKKIFTFIICSVFVIVFSSCSKSNNRVFIDKEVAKGDIKNEDIIGSVNDNKVIINNVYGNKIEFNKNNKVIEDFYEYNSFGYPLLAKIEENNIYLYEDKDKGVILVKDDIVQYLKLGELGYITPRFILPRMFYEDFDNDKEKEIAIILYVGSGTGVSFEELHIIEENKIGDKTFFKANSFDRIEYCNKIVKKLKYEINNKSNNILMNLDGTEYIIDTIGEIDILAFGDVTYFYVEDNSIKMRIGLGVIEKNTATAQNNGFIECEVLYSGDYFELNNYKYDTSSDFCIIEY